MVKTEQEKQSDYYNKALEVAKAENPDYAKAADLLKKAEAAGSSKALFALGSWYFHGRHFEKDINLAISYWERAIEAKNSEAALELGTLYERGELVKKDMAKAFHYYCIGALFEGAKAHYEVSRFFYYGFYVPKDIKLSEFWRDRAEELGYVEEH